MERSQIGFELKLWLCFTSDTLSELGQVSFWAWLPSQTMGILPTTYYLAMCPQRACSSAKNPAAASRGFQKSYPKLFNLLTAPQHHCSPTSQAILQWQGISWNIPHPRAFALSVPAVLTLSAHLAPASLSWKPFWICQLPPLLHIHTLGSPMWPWPQLIIVVTTLFIIIYL